MATIMDSNIREKVERTTFLIGKYSEEGAYIMPNSENTTMFEIELLCHEPYKINDDPSVLNYRYNKPNSNYDAFVFKQSSSVLPVSYSENDNFLDRKEDLDYFYSNRYIVFQPQLNYVRNTDSIHKNVIIQDVIEIPQVLNENTRFIVVPKVDLDRKLFEKKISSSDEYFELEYFPGDVSGIAYIMCDSYLYFCEAWEYDENNPTQWYRSADKPVYVMKVEKNSNRFISEFKNNDSIIFMDEDYPQELFETRYLLNGKNEEEVKSINTNETIINTKDEDTFNDEYAMLLDFKTKVLNSGLCYDFTDLINLHTCIKSSPLTILAGMSGTGKTQIALKYAKMIDANEANKRLLFMSISPSYTEPDDILGYYNDQTGKYVPSDTGLVDFLIRAQDNTDKMYMVIFDEMNLSQIEYWFSPFISILEKDADSRKLVLYNETKKTKDNNYLPTINIGNNVLFVGTVNLDETTKDISDRLLDRSYVINLKKRKFLDFKTEYDNKVSGLGDKNICDSAMLFNGWRSKEAAINAFTSEELQFLDELHELISNVDEQKGVSYRVLKHIGMYILNIPKDDFDNYLIDKRKAFDIVLKQTVMKKLSGPENKLSDLIGHVASLDSSKLPLDSSIIKLFNQYSQISDFTECKELLRRKAGELLIYGYTR